jgi:hypothetical protein
MQPMAGTKSRNSHLGRDPAYNHTIGGNGKRIRLQITLKSVQELLRTVAAATRRIVVDAIRMLHVANVDPETTRFGTRQRSVQNRYGGVIGVNDPQPQHILDHQIVERSERFGGGSHPATHGAAADADAMPRQELFQAIQRKMVAVFANDDVRQQTPTGEPLVDRLRRLTGQSDTLFTLTAGILKADVLDHEQRRRLVFELFAGLLTDFRSLLAAC